MTIVITIAGRYGRAKAKYYEEGESLSDQPLEYQEACIQSGHAVMVDDTILLDKNLPENSGVTTFDITDAAKSLADEREVDLTYITGSGSRGRILKSDVEKLLESSA